MTASQPDADDLHRFLDAQERDYDRALTEIRSGRKRTHWMWYIFPQFAGLGVSPLSQQYAIRSLSEGKAYITHSILGSRLVECAEAVLSIEGRSAAEIFGTPDDMKLRSCATLFEMVSPPGSIFERLLAKYYDGVRDPLTLDAVVNDGAFMAETRTLRTRFEGADPILSVADMSRSLRYYIDVLGFTNAEWGGDDFTCVTRDNASIYLSQGDQGHPGTWVWIGVDDVEALYIEYKASGAMICHPPENYPWAYEMKVTDPDGHVLRFGSEPQEDTPEAK